MFRRLGIPPKLRPVWVQQQFAKQDAIIHNTATVGNTVWVLVYTSQAESGSPQPPDYLLRDPVYLQLMQ